MRALDVDGHIIQDAFNGRVRFTDAHAHTLWRKLTANVHGNSFGERFEQIETLLLHDLFHDFVDLRVIDGQTEIILQRFLSGMPVRMEAAKGRPELHAVIVDVDEATGKARAIRRHAIGGD